MFTVGELPREPKKSRRSEHNRAHANTALGTFVFTDGKYDGVFTRTS